MNVFLIDGTYELFRHFYAVPSATDAEGREVGAVRGVVGSVLGMLSGEPMPVIDALARSNDKYRPLLGALELESID